MMHSKNIEIQREEAQRLIDRQINLFTRMKDTEGVFRVDSKSVETRATFDSESTANAIEVLRGEQTKLSKLDLVLAVVGTMKAGKSTTINAIVGKEVLPNRNRAMTALPTLIRHTPGQKKPVLIFENDQPINDLIGRLRNVLSGSGSAEAIHSIREDQDMSALVDCVNNHEEFGQQYDGTEEIFLFLKRLNDLVRLASHLGVEFPFSDYGEVHELPVIEVEFSYLSDSETTAGRLTLLDTPGPNEAGQHHLKRMLRDQLSRASAVMAVLDYTQLKTNADDQVRRELLSIADMTEGRLYALVNRFDQRNQHSDTEEQVRNYVSEVLLTRKVPKDAVFAVSALHAYLANRMLSEIKAGRSLEINAPDSKWVHDFADLAFGMWDADDLKDISHVRSRAEKLWRKSLFNDPLEGVIKSAHASAALLAVQSASDKLVNYAERLNNFFGARTSGLLKESEDLKEQIDQLKADIDSVAQAEKKIEKQLETALSDVDSAMQKQSSIVQVDVKDAVDKLFETGKSAEQREIELEKESVEPAEKSSTREGGSSNTSNYPRSGKSSAAHVETARPSKSILSILVSEAFSKNRGKNRYLGERIFDPDNAVVELKSKEEADKIKDGLDKELSSVMRIAETQIRAEIDRAVDKFDERASKTVGDAIGGIKDRINERLAKANLDIELKMPRLPSIRLELENQDVLNDMVENKQKTVTKSRVKNGLWSGFANFLNDNWGRENYSETESFFLIDMDRVRKEVDASVDKMFDRYRSALGDQLRKPLEKEIHRFFEAFNDAIGAIRADLQQSLVDKRKTQGEQDELHERLTALKKNVELLLMDGKGLRKDIEQGSY